jgi:hypothetical protein
MVTMALAYDIDAMVEKTGRTAERLEARTGYRRH